MSKPVMCLVNLPFDGFYESTYSSAIDHEEERFIEDRCNESEHDTDEANFPDELRLNESEYVDIVMAVTSYSDAYRTLARDYVAAFDYLAGQTFGMGKKDVRKRYNIETREFEDESYVRPSIHAEFESMDSPREYNFTTDRLYANIPLVIMRVLLKRSKAEKHATLAAVIKERFTSRSGFISYYSNQLEEWLEKPISDWDHNELGTLLIAAMRLAGSDVDERDTRWSLYESTVGDEGAYQAWSDAVDWEELDKRVLEARAEKLVAWIEKDSDAVATWRDSNRETYESIVAADKPAFVGFEESNSLPYRCSETLDLFANR